MLKYLDRALAIMLLLGAAIGHTFGSVTTYGHQPMVLYWALHATVLGILLGSLNLLRSWRPHDRALALITACGTAAWAISAGAFGILIGNPGDPRVVGFVIIAVLLVGFSATTAMRWNR